MNVRTRGLKIAFAAVVMFSVNSGCLWKPHPQVYNGVEVARQDVPDEVLKSFAQWYPDATITSIEASGFTGSVERVLDYTIVFEEAGQQHRVTIDPTGDVLVPAEVCAAFERRYPEAAIISVSRYNEGRITRYMVLFEEHGQRRRAHFDPKGNTLPPPSN